MDKKEIKGLCSEFWVILVLEKLKEARVIVNYFHSAPRSLNDMKGVDIYLTIMKSNKRIFMPLQIKSSMHYVKKHLATHKGIPAINSFGDYAEKKQDIILKKLKTIIAAFKRGEIIGI